MSNYIGSILTLSINSQLEHTVYLTQKHLNNSDSITLNLILQFKSLKIYLKKLHNFIFLAYFAKNESSAWGHANEMLNNLFRQ